MTMGNTLYRQIGFTPLLLIATGTVFQSESANAGSTREGEPCSVSNTHLDKASYKLITDCDERTFCLASSNSSGTGTCIRRLCRNDIFPFGFPSNESFPSLCPTGTYCPDEGSGCQPLNNLGSPCEMSRDYQCTPPDWEALASPWNAKGAVCLKSTCMYANVTLGLPCIIDSVLYTGYGTGLDGQEFSTTIIRDNCVTSSLYCDSLSMTCVQNKEEGESCTSDRECESFNCNTENACAEAPGTPLKIESWQYALTALAILSTLACICTFLVLAHKRQRLARHQEIRDYYNEQTSLRASIVALHAATAERLDDEKSSLLTNHQSK